MQPGSARPSSEIIPSPNGWFCKQKLSCPKELPKNLLCCTVVVIPQPIKWPSGCNTCCDPQAANPDLLLVKNQCCVVFLNEMCIAVPSTGSHLCSMQTTYFQKTQNSLFEWNAQLSCDSAHTMTIFLNKKTKKVTDFEFLKVICKILNSVQILGFCAAFSVLPPLLFPLSWRQGNALPLQVTFHLLLVLHYLGFWNIYLGQPYLVTEVWQLTNC